MEKKFKELPNWTFWIDVVSAGQYNGRGKDESFGANVDFTDDDPEKLLEDARQTAAHMQRQIRGN